MNCTTRETSLEKSLPIVHITSKEGAEDLLKTYIKDNSIAVNKKMLNYHKTL